MAAAFAGGRRLSLPPACLPWQAGPPSSHKLGENQRGQLQCSDAMALAGSVYLC